MIGTTISHYKVLEKIGEGGMGIVYRATDTKLNRDVALKILPEQFASDSQRMGRFQREAEVLASLDHPNIGQIYGIEEAGATKALVLQLIEGPTLAEKIAQGPIPVEETLKIALQIAEGLEAAHEKGVIHRDLKPANIKITPEGQVKILDFGLAKAFEEEVAEADISQSPTLTEEMTRAGVILGTAAYMSPEQAKGEAVDKRADIFAFGCVLYELLTGKRTFDGKTITETLAKILEGEPNWDALPDTTPWSIRNLLRRCLTKDPHDRLEGIANVRVEIKLALSEPTTVSPTDVAGVVPPVRQRWVLTVGLVVGAFVVGLAVWLLIQPSSPEQSLSRLEIRPSPPVVLASSVFNEVAISPDGRQLVYMGVGEEGSQLYLRSLDNFVDRPIPGTEGAGAVFFSPDGSSIGFFAEAKLKKTSLSGGSPITLYDTRPGLRSGDWFEDTILFAGTLPSGQGLYRVSANGGEPEMLATPNPDEGETAYGLPDFLPGGKDLLFTIQLNTGFRTALLSLETGERKVVLENARQARYLSTGHLVYEQSRTGNLMVAPFDLAALEVTGDSVPVVQGVRHTPTSYVDYAVSDNGTLVYVPSMGNPKRTLIWVDREGRKIEPLTEALDAYYFPRLSPDGKRLAVGIEMEDGRDIWVYEINLGTRIRLTIEGANEWPVWTRDGSRITFQHNDKDLYWTLADGSGEAEPFLTREYELAGMSWRPGEQRLAFYELNPVGGRDIWTLSPEGDASPFLVTSFNERSPIFSPDGQWLTYVSNESGRDEVYVQPYPGPGRKWPISREGGAEPTWSPDGRELFYRQGRKMMVVTVNTGTTFAVGEPRLLFEGEYLLDANGNANYDVFPDGTRFVMIEAGEESAPAQINIVLNWFEELKRLVPTN